MAGYTAANNIFGFLYVAVNSVTQACMSFTSQNYGVHKFRRMDKVLVDCLIISVVTSFSLGCGAYFFGSEILKIYTADPEVIRCGLEILSYTTVPYFLCGIMDLFPGAAWNGTFRRSNDPVSDRNSRNQDCLDILGIPKTSFFRCTFYFYPRIMVSYHCITSNLLLFCAEKAQKSHRDG